MRDGDESARACGSIGLTGSASSSPAEDAEPNDVADWVTNRRTL
ncbi:hypothetical protein [Bifidobacterium pseudolongum]|nr:hypothetical protein [Bifidobacterium pseudolongum]